MAEALFRHHAAAKGLGSAFEIDSAGTGGWHAGERPDSRMRETAASGGIELDGAARQVVPEDLTRFDYILCMDRDNQRDVEQLGQSTASVELMLAYHSDDATLDVPDPYYGGGDGFMRVFSLLHESTSRFLETLREQHDLTP